MRHRFTKKPPVKSKKGKKIQEAVKIISGRQTPHHGKRRQIPAGQEKKKKLEVDYCKHSTVCYHVTPQDRSVHVFCVQIETALSGRHCILKQGHDVFITLSRSIHVTLTQPGQNTQGLPSTLPRQEGDLTLSVPHTHNRGYQPSMRTLIESK